MDQFSVYVLLYGPHPELTRRCLGRLVRSLCEARLGGLEPVKRLHIGLNGVSLQSADEARWAVNRLLGVVPVTWYKPPDNVGKYPLMRRMFRHPTHVPARYTMWFDDDSYLDHEMNPGAAADWWRQMLQRMPLATMVGQIWHLPVKDQQLAWMQTQPWYDPTLPPPPPWPPKNWPQAFHFCQGAWWAAHTQFLQEVDWPIPELVHCGGDSLLGEVVRQRRGRLLHCDTGVRINADDAGQHSRAARRGWRQPEIGRDYAGVPLERHKQHEFELEIWDQ